MIASGVVLFTILAFIITFERVWPFTPEGITRRLQQHSSATIEFGSFRRVFFPRPGFIAEQIVLRASPSAAPSVTMKRLTVLASYSGLISKSISRVQAEGLVLRVSMGVASQNLEFHTGPKKNERELKLDQLVADGSTLEVTSGEGGEPLVFPIARLRIEKLGDHSASKFEVALQNPRPAMQIAARGEIGPWRADEPLLTPLSGSFAVSNGQLGSVPALNGILTSKGRFSGMVENIEVSGIADVGSFAVRRANHPMPLRVHFASVVSTRHAQVKLESLSAQLGKTHISGSGVISADKQHSSDVVNLMLVCNQGRVDDLLRLFVSSPQPSMSGPIQFRARADVEHGNRPFLERVRLNGTFVINDAHFTSPNTQDKLNKLSARAQGNPKEEHPPDRTVSTLSSDVDMKDGIASLSNVKFQVPGADASGEGTFNVLNTRVQLHGKLRMSAELSEANKGVKSFFLKLIDPIFRKRGAGAEIPAHVTGTAKQPNFKVGLK